MDAAIDNAPANAAMAAAANVSREGSLSKLMMAAAESLAMAMLDITQCSRSAAVVQQDIDEADWSVDPDQLPFAETLANIVDAARLVIEAAGDAATPYHQLLGALVKAQEDLQWAS